MNGLISYIRTIAVSLLGSHLVTWAPSLFPPSVALGQTRQCSPVQVVRPKGRRSQETLSRDTVSLRVCTSPQLNPSARCTDFILFIYLT